MAPSSEPPEQLTTETTARDGSAPRIVGIGASAGGLDALGRFLGAVPPASGLAFVVVQHMDPHRPDLLPELLQRTTDMPVAAVTDDLVVEADHVYVISPGQDLAMCEGRLTTTDRDAKAGARLRIDTFFCSLAEDQQVEAVGVVLSGTGSDGTIGLRSVRDAGGMTLVQDPATAEFDGMPRSAVDAGVTDVVARAEDLPRSILDGLGSLDANTDAGDDGTALVLSILRERGGPDFSRHKPTSVGRRIGRRMAVRQVEHLHEYAELLRGDHDEAQLLVKELLIGVTTFFRDPDIWTVVRDEVIPALVDAVPPGTMLRAWVAGCSTGQEAYTLAMIFREALEHVDPARRCTLKIFASDLDPDAIEWARCGIYPSDAADELGEARLRRFFVEDDGGYRVSPQVREMVVFAVHDVTEDPPFTKLDLVCCRNLLIYFSSELQAKVLARFHYALRPHGALVLGSAEATTAAAQLFTSFGTARHVFRRSDAEVAHGMVDFPRDSTKPPTASHRPSTEPPLGSLVDAVIAREHAPAAVLTNEDGDVLHASGHTGDFLEPAIGAASLNVFSMARGGVGESLLETFQSSLIEGATSVARGVEYATRGDGSRRAADITVRPLREPEQLDGLVLIVFEETVEPRIEASGAPQSGSDESTAAALAGELQACRLRARVVREEMQASREELTSANEELQSTNEELSTSREELQSTNEELRTINSELEAKVQELSRAGDDMKNLLDSTGSAILFLDRDLRVRRFTPKAVDVMRLRSSDVGRPFTDLASDLDYPDLASDAASVLEHGSPISREVTAAEDRWFLVGSIPYQTQRGDVDGVVLTFGDITRTKELEFQLRSFQVGLQEQVADQAIELDDANRRLDDREDQP